MTLALGLVLMVIRAVASSSGKNLQRYGQQPGQRKTGMNALGIVLKVVSGPMDAIAYSIAPQLTLAPFGMFLGLLFDYAAATPLHGDAVGAPDVVAGVMVVSGTVICLFSGAHGDPDERVAPATGPLLIYMLLVGTVCAALVSVIMALQRVGGFLDAMAHASLGGLLGSVSLVAGKSWFRSLTIPGTPLLTIAECALAVGMIAPTHLYVLNRGFGRHSLVFISPVGSAFGLLANVATGLCLYGEVPESPGWFLVGVVTACVGVALLCSRKHKAEQSRQDEAVFASMIEAAYPTCHPVNRIGNET